MTLEERRVIWEKRKIEKRNRILKRIALISIGIMLTALITIFISTNVQADSTNLHKYYTTINIQPDETLWDIANNNMRGYHSTQDYIDEVVFINNLDNPDSIYSGMTLVIPYFDNNIY